MKRNVLMRGNSSDTVMIEGLGLYVPMSQMRLLQAEVERLQLQLAACGVVAMANTPDSAARQRDMHPDYMSASCQDVIRAVDREMALREERDQLKAILQQFMSLNQHDRDLPLELFAIQRSVSAKAVSLASHDAEVIERLKNKLLEFAKKSHMHRGPGIEFAVDLMDDRIDQLRHQVKEVKS